MQNGVPSGAIILWSGAVGSIPAGWYLCNGANGTPNLQDRFIVGAGSVYAVGATGGSANAVVVSHSHSVSGSTTSNGNHSHGTSIANGNSGTQGSNKTSWGSGQATIVTYDAGTHSHTLSGTADATGSSATNANLPPYYALAYIMKS